MSQLDLAVATGVMSRHISFVETGRSSPSRDMLDTLATGLDMPLRDRNDLYLAAGYAPPYRELGLDAPELAATSTHSALNLGNAGGAFLGGWAITHTGLSSLPWIGAGLTGAGFVLMLWSYLRERKVK